jgi:recombination protein RecT
VPDARTALAKRDEAVTNLSRYVERLGPQIARALPAHLSGDRMTRLALTAVRQTPKLAETSELSFAGSLLTAAALGLEVNTPTGEAYLVPYGQECQLIVGYQGWTKMFWQHPLAAGLVAEAVYPEDEFDYSLGSGGYLRHKPRKHQRAKDSEPVFYYCHIRLSSGAESWVVLTPDEVKELRGGKVGPDPRFKGGDPQRWMERKTAIRQATKMIPRTPTLAKAHVADESTGTELYKAAAAERVDVPPGDASSPEGALEGVVEDPPGGPGTEGL